MLIICSNCKSQLNINEAKLPADKVRAMVKCPKCAHQVIFDIPKIDTPTLHTQKPTPQDDKTEVGERTYIGNDKTEVNAFANTANVLKARLVEVASGKVHQLILGENILGRKGNIMIDDGYTSRKHCLIEINKTNTGFVAILSDSGAINNGQPSKNGTYYKGSKVSTHDKILLKHNDKIKIGHTELVFMMK